MSPAWTAPLAEARLALDATRTQRAAAWRRGVHPPRRSLQELDPLLRGHHPDYAPGASRALRLGPSAGTRVPRELAEVLEAAAPELAAPEEGAAAAALLSADLLVLGGGVAGLAAALTARQAGSAVLIATRGRLGDGASASESDGFPVGLGEGDTPPAHLLDLLSHGRFAARRPLAAVLAAHAAEALAWLLELGVAFERDGAGRIKTRSDDGSPPRLCRAGERTGRAIAQVLREAYLAEGGEALERHEGASLLCAEDGACVGARLRAVETGARVDVRAGAVVLATGTSGLALAYRAGVRVVAMESRHFSAGGIAYPQALERTAVPDAVLASGAAPVAADGSRLFHPDEPRDVQVAAILEACADPARALRLPDGRGAVWLDLPLFGLLQGAGSFSARFPALSRALRAQGLDPARDPVPARPSVDHDLGGLLADADGTTSVPGLFATGRAVGGVHGRGVAPGAALLASVVLPRRIALPVRK